jgi:hypothetical protein
MRIFTLNMAAVFVVALLAVPAAAYQVTPQVIGSGGGTASGGDYQIAGTVGQAAVGVTAGASDVHEIGFWYQPCWILTGIPDQGDIPTSFGLMQNSPNPFNPVTTLAYDLTSPARVSIKLYDVSGREVRTLVDGDVESGRHSVVLSAVGLPSGVYFCRMMAGNFTETRKMTLLK